MELSGLCSVCGKPGRMYTCSICGRNVCGAHFDMTHGMCSMCERR
ncbi:MAG: orotate phosphoribosyltransferase [Thermoplasmata archaeon]|nr:MAG: orotate phosphoribosyltransferase [Thermoplasmata archaeon]RLF41098.1 MAG: orotate phosphoribosyltransferase [Thermoplasmata archaeon]RLF61771.1 MAG: orotate phosphoribosyltransferase [Thermoplasmata archaeon]HDN50692.1 orotate phosphoribosyltransferase [Thermoplasmatales archaeon]